MSDARIGLRLRGVRLVVAERVRDIGSLVSDVLRPERVTPMVCLTSRRGERDAALDPREVRTPDSSGEEHPLIHDRSGAGPPGRRDRATNVQVHACTDIAE